MIEIRNIRLAPDWDEAALKEAAAGILGISVDEILSHRLLRRSVDARRREVLIVLSVAVTVSGDEASLVARADRAEVRLYVKPALPLPVKLSGAPEPPVVCGSGPAGLFAALELALAGARPILIERGADADRRLEAVRRFHRTGILDPETNIQFGEGGAGTFSDGKLNTGVNDPRCARVLETFTEAGAPEEILWQSKPHIGTDLLPGVVKNIRERIIALGGQVWFHTRLEDLIIREGKLEALRIRRGDVTDELPARVLVLAAGHSARDVFEMLKNRGVHLAAKAFSIGLRVEHSQKLIDKARYGRYAGTPGLGAADYKLSCQLPSCRGVYSFCMCPGGVVAAAASEPGRLAVNGMSPFARDGENANAAILAGVEPGDFGGGADPLAGIAFQRRWEEAAFRLGGGDFKAPAQLLGDFLQGRGTKSGPGGVLPSYPLGVRWGDVSACLPAFAVGAIRDAFPRFDRLLPGFTAADAVLTGVETRSSSPVRVLRDDRCQANVVGLFPCGEGAGYAGGIMSAAVDGLRVAQAVLDRYKEGK